MAVAVTSCRGQHTQAPSTQPTNQHDTLHFAELTYIEDFHDFGTIQSGEIVAYTFRFRNDGNAPLIVKDVITSCGCTSTKLSQTVFEPHEEGSIELTFNSKGWFGSQYKQATLRTNSTIHEKSVTIKANVVK